MQHWNYVSRQTSAGRFLHVDPTIKTLNIIPSSDAEINAAAEFPHTLCDVKCELGWTWIERASTNKILNYVINTSYSAPIFVFVFTLHPARSSHKSTASSLRDGTEHVTVSTIGNFYFIHLLLPVL